MVMDLGALGGEKTPFATFNCSSERFLASGAEREAVLLTSCSARWKWRISRLSRRLSWLSGGVCHLKQQNRPRLRLVSGLHDRSSGEGQEPGTLVYFLCTSTPNCRCRTGVPALAMRKSPVVSGRRHSGVAVQQRLPLAELLPGLSLGSALLQSSLRGHYPPLPPHQVTSP